MSAASSRPSKTAFDQRVQAVVAAARYYGIELNPADFCGVKGEEVPSGASLSAWAQESGLWSRALRLRWRHLMRLQDAGPVVLVFTDASAVLLTNVDPDQEIVMLQDPLAPAGAPAVAVDKLRLARLWAGDVVLLRAKRGVGEAEAPFTMRWLGALVMKERRSLRDISPNHAPRDAFLHIC